MTNRAHAAYIGLVIALGLVLNIALLALLQAFGG
jgi:hypothetical protein